MKKILLCAIALIMAFSMIPVSAANGGDIMYGTPVVDGILDDMYTKSVCVELEKMAFWTNGKTSAKTSAEGTKTYILWDEKYLYLCTVINDTTATKSAESGVDYTSWSAADNVEHYIRTPNGSKGGQVHIAALAKGLMAEAGVCDTANAVCAATVTDTGYITEIALPLEVVELKAGSQFGYSLQYNDYIPDDGATIASGKQKADEIVIMTLSSESVNPPVVEVSEAPATSDAAVTALAAALMGIIIAAKVKKTK